MMAEFLAAGLTEDYSSGFYFIAKTASAAHDVERLALPIATTFHTSADDNGYLPMR